MLVFCGQSRDEGRWRVAADGLTSGAYAGLRAFSRDVIGMRLPRRSRPPWLLDGAYSWCEGGFNYAIVSSGDF